MTLPFTVTEQRATTTEERSAQEQGQRLTTNGLHTLAAGSSARMLPVCWGQFHGLLIWILIVAGVILALLGEGLECIAIVVVNAIIVFCQECSEDTSQAALQKRSAPCATMQHEGRVTLLPAPCLGSHAVDGSGDGEERKTFGRPTTY